VPIDVFLGKFRGGSRQAGEDLGKAGNRKFKEGWLAPSPADRPGIQGMLSSNREERSLWDVLKEFRHGLSQKSHQEKAVLHVLKPIQHVQKSI